MIKPVGLILAGGQSKRMGKPKAWINYHGEPQVVWLNLLLKPLCSEIIISINDQSFHPAALNFQSDLPQFADHGPISGVLTAFEIKDQALLVVGCDYPYLDLESLELLLAARNESNFVTCFKNSTGFIEPLIACYEKEAKVPMNAHFKNGFDSLNRFITNNNSQVIDCLEPRILISADSPDFKFESKK